MTFQKNPILFLATSWITLGAVGPVLSYFSLQETGFPTDRAFLYSLVTFFMDFINIVLLALLFRKLSQIHFPKTLFLSTYIYIPLWIFDVFDLSQKLRLLSNLGLIFSFYLLYKILDEKRHFLKLGITHLTLYILNGLISETIAFSPLTKTLLEELRCLF